MAYVSFLRGLQSGLNSQPAVDGVFYLTTDTNRLYVGQSDGKGSVTRRLLNQTVQIIDTSITGQSLPTANANIVNDFYYLLRENILAVCVPNSAGGYEWAQINPDTYVGDVTTSVGAISNNSTTITQIGATVRGGVVQNDSAFTTSMKVAGADGITLEKTAGTSGSPDTLTIKGTEYDLTSSVSTTGNAFGVATLTLNDSKDTANNTSVSIEGSNFVTLSNNNGKIKIEGVDFTVDGLEASIDTNNNNLYKIELTQSGNNSNSQSLTFNRDINYGVNHSSKAYLGGNLDVYTTAETDSKITEALKNLNGLKYKGIASSSQPLPTTGVEIGDMYLAQNTITYKDTDGTNKSAQKGDLLIAVSANTTNPENANGKIETADLRWTYVPSGDEADTDTTYSFLTDKTNTKLNIQSSTDSTGEYSGSVQVASGDSYITVDGTDSTTTGLIAKVSHANVTRSDPAVIANDNTPYDTLEGIVVGVTSDAKGHITAVQKKNLKIGTSYLKSAATVSAASDVATITTTLLNTAGGVEDSTSVAKIGSESLTVTASSNQVNINLEWGTW